MHMRICGAQVASGRYRHRSSLSRPQKADRSFEKFSECIGFCFCFSLFISHWLAVSSIKIHILWRQWLRVFHSLFYSNQKDKATKNVWWVQKKILSKKSKHNIGIFKISNLRAGETVQGSRPLKPPICNPSAWEAEARGFQKFKAGLV